MADGSRSPPKFTPLAATDEGLGQNPKAEAGACILLEVKDSGTGMAPDIKNARTDQTYVGADGDYRGDMTLPLEKLLAGGGSRRKISVIGPVWREHEAPGPVLSVLLGSGEAVEVIMAWRPR